MCAGRFDLMLIARAESIPALRDVLLERIQRIEGVRSTETVVILDEIGWVHCRPAELWFRVRAGRAIEPGDRLAEKRRRPPRLDGFGEPEALCVATAHLAQELVLRRRLDALGDDLDRECLAHGDDDLDELGRARIGAEIVDERAIDLQCAHREAMQRRAATTSRCRSRRSARRSRPRAALR